MTVAVRHGTLPMVPDTSDDLVDWLQEREGGTRALKPGNAARLHWNTPDARRKTPVALVYLHGFTASPNECAGNPERLAEALQANAFAARLPGHGLDVDEALHGISPQDWIDSAHEALAIGRALGDKVILVGTSLGASLACLLAAGHPEEVSAVVAWSLGARARDPAELDRLCAATDILRDPRPRSEAQQLYWSSAVHPDGYRALRRLFQDCMTPATAARVHVPFYLAYYYRDAEHHDQTASVPAMLSIFDALGTPSELRRAQAFTDGTHVIASPWRSPAAEAVLRASRDFLLEVGSSGR